MTPKLIFIFSLPRSGSTWLQRIISMHPDVATSSEPWLLLPLLSPIKNEFGIQPYEHDLCLIGIKEALSNTNDLNEWKKRYLEGAKLMANKIYSELSGSHKFFLDKTPRYSLICEEIIETFPDAKFIFLWRHPISIIFSMQNTWGKKLWVIPKFKIDLFNGLFNLIDTHEKYKTRVHSVQYEQLVNNSQFILDNLFSYLDLEYYPDLIKNAQKNVIPGVMGDPNQNRADGGVANSDWNAACKKFCLNLFRKHWLKSYVTKVGISRFSKMGYNFYDAIEAINCSSAKSLGVVEWIKHASVKLRTAIINKVSTHSLGRECVFFRLP